MFLRPHVLPPLVSQIFLYCTCFHNNKPLFSYIRLARQLVLSLARILLCLLSLSSSHRAPKSRDLVSLFVLVLSSRLRLRAPPAILWSFEGHSTRPSPASRHFSSSRETFDSARRLVSCLQQFTRLILAPLSARLTKCWLLLKSIAIVWRIINKYY